MSWAIAKISCVRTASWKLSDRRLVPLAEQAFSGQRALRRDHRGGRVGQGYARSADQSYDEEYCRQMMDYAFDKADVTESATDDALTIGLGRICARRTKRPCRLATPSSACGCSVPSATSTRSISGPSKTSSSSRLLQCREADRAARRKPVAKRLDGSQESTRRHDATATSSGSRGSGREGKVVPFNEVFIPAARWAAPDEQGQGRRGPRRSLPKVLGGDEVVEPVRRPACSRSWNGSARRTTRTSLGPSSTASGPTTSTWAS